jgi:hypothetical protein
MLLSLFDRLLVQTSGQLFRFIFQAGERERERVRERERERDVTSTALNHAQFLILT